MDSGNAAVQLALDGRLTEGQAVEMVEEACGSGGLAREILEKVASAGVMGRRRLASSLVDWVLAKCSGNPRLLSAVVALMLCNGSLAAHEVVEGDTLWKLGGGTRKGVEQLLALNPSVTEQTVLKPGMKLALPSEQGSGLYRVVDGDTLGGIAVRIGVPLKQLVEWNPQLEDVDRLAVGQEIRTRADAPAVGKPVKKPKPAAGGKPVPAMDAATEFVAKVLYAESGSSEEDMEMIAHLVVNRMKSSLFPADAYGVVTQRGQFACAAGGDGNRRFREWSPSLDRLSRKACELAAKVMKGDASGMKGSDGMLFYCTKAMAEDGVGKGTDGLAKEYGHPSGWGEHSVFTPVETSDSHVFYKCEPKRKRK